MLDIWNNASLTSVEGISGITRTGSLIIGENDQLTTLKGTRRVKTIERDIEIIDNIALTELALDKLYVVGNDFIITGNEKLCSELAQELKAQLDSRGGIDGDVLIQNNLNCEMGD